MYVAPTLMIEGASSVQHRHWIMSLPMSRQCFIGSNCLFKF